MALKLKKYTETYSGLDAAYYLSRKAPIVVIITNRNTGKTTNILGEIAKSGKGFMLLTRYKNEMQYAQNKMMDACLYYDEEICYDKKKECFLKDNKPIGFIGALAGAQDIKNSAERYHNVEYVVFDEFLPTDKRYIREGTAPGYELEALRWILGSIRKGRESYQRDIKVVLMANLVDAMNPYLNGLFDSTGTSLLTHVARAVHGGQTNITLDDPNVFLTVHIDKRFESNDSLGSFIDGYAEGGMASGFLSDFMDKVRAKTKTVEKQLKTPVVSIGTASMYRIVLKTRIPIAGSDIQFNQTVFYWTPSKLKASTTEEMNRVDFFELQHWYSDIVTKAQVKDFFKLFANATKIGI